MKKSLGITTLFIFMYLSLSYFIHLPTMQWKDNECRQLLPFTFAGIIPTCTCNNAGQYECEYIYPEGVNPASVEEHGKIAVAQLPFTADKVREHGADNVRISALGYDLIKDQDYVRQLLSEAYEGVDCIITVDWPDGERIYIELLTADGEEYVPHTPEEFEQLIARAPLGIKQTFYANINDDQTYVQPYLLGHMTE